MKQDLIGILGGTFDPVHFGHLRMGLELLQILPFDQIRWIPCADPVHKPSAHASAQHRLAMLELATEAVKGFVVDDREVKRASPSYMVTTLETLRNDFPDVSLVLIVGVDALNSLPTWHQWQKLFELAHILVVTRPEYEINLQDNISSALKPRLTRDISQLQQQTSGLIFQQNTTHLSISSTYIRQQLQKGLSSRYLLPSTVLEYITQNKIYKK